MQRLRILDDVGRSLLIWIHEKQLQGDTFNENVKCEKVKLILADLVKKTPGSTVAEKGFNREDMLGSFYDTKALENLSPVHSFFISSRVSHQLLPFLSI
ncbi:hypothetical protein AVEN_171944-1 [Araneus ventricosus]|uniref:Uncharacterized protein n=1 Tax=Araneus ventricosus TaxID=182803 RepID=A0A4Y2URR6_ARAVE|nr:hypothetical protein AVEN_171944-1 [Araneus ventricosus]